MKKKILVAVTAATLMVVSGAQASGLYINFDGGAVFTPHVNLAATTFQLDPGYDVGGSFGYTLPNYFGLSPASSISLQGDLLYSQSRFASVSGVRIYTKLANFSAMGDLIYGYDLDARTGLPFTLYVGAGVGEVETIFKGLAASLNSNFSNYGFGWQAIGGVSYKLENKVSVFLEYRLLEPVDVTIGGGAGYTSYTSNNLIAGIKIPLGDF